MSKAKPELGHSKKIRDSRPAVTAMPALDPIGEEPCDDPELDSRARKVMQEAGATILTSTITRSETFGAVWRGDYSHPNRPARCVIWRASGEMFASLTVFVPEANWRLRPGEGAPCFRRAQSHA